MAKKNGMGTTSDSGAKSTGRKVGTSPLHMPARRSHGKGIPPKGK